jgi:hypothetical protein
MPVTIRAGRKIHRMTLSTPGGGLPARTGLAVASIAGTFVRSRPW